MQQNKHLYGDALPFLFNEFFTFYFHNAKDIRNLALCNSIFQLATFLWLKYGSRKFKFSFTSSCNACFKGNGYQVLNNENKNEMKTLADEQNYGDQTFSRLWLKNRPDCSSFIFVWLQHFFGTVLVPLISTHLVTQATPGFTQEDKARWGILGGSILFILLTSKLYQSIICKILLLDKTQLEDDIRHHHHLMEVLLNTLSSFFSYAYMLWKDIGDLGDHIPAVVNLKLLGQDRYADEIIYRVMISFNKKLTPEHRVCGTLNHEFFSLRENQAEKEAVIPCRGSRKLSENFTAFTSNQSNCTVFLEPIPVMPDWEPGTLPCKNTTAGDFFPPILKITTHTSSAHSCQPSLFILLLPLIFLIKSLSRCLGKSEHQAMPRRQMISH